MRLFVAILPDEAMRQALSALQREMKLCGIHGRYTDPFNLHMTLAFIGECQPNPVLDVLTEIPFEPVKLKPEGILHFRDLYACTLSGSPQLTAYVSRLHHALAEQDIPFDRKAFRPHITLVRKAVAEYREYPDLYLPEMTMTAERISLMRSQPGRNGMVYTEIGAVPDREEE